MKRKITITISFILISLTLFSQTNFERGYHDGYKRGYCKGQIGCIPPIPKIAPMPNIYESSDNYVDGYERGYEDGISNQKRNSYDNGSNYRTADPERIDYMMDLPEQAMFAVEAQVGKTRALLAQLKNQIISDYKNQNYRTALNKCLGILDTHIGANDVFALDTAAKCYYMLGDKVKALEYFRKVYRLNPNHETSKIISKIRGY